MSNLYYFGEFVLNPGGRTLSRADSPISLTPKAFDVLLFLVQNPNRLVTKEELLRAVWGDVVVEEGNLTQYISHLRKALCDSTDDARLIVTIARKGYQFTPRVASRATDILLAAAHQAATGAISTADARFVEYATNGETAEEQRTSLRFEITYYCNVIGDWEKK